MKTKLLHSVITTLRLPELIVPAVLTVFPVATLATEGDTLTHHTLLKEIVVSGASQSGTRIKADGTITLNNSRIGDMMQLFGEADAVRYLKMMPGVTTSSDYASGISIDGAEFSHTTYRIGDAPVFFPYHFGGVFSTFNNRHFSSTTLDRTCGKGKGPNMIGASIDFITPTDTDSSAHASLNVGIVNSGMSISIPVNRKLWLSASARLSYLNLLYGNLLEDNETKTRYDFHDVNITANYIASDADRLTINLFRNADRLKYTNDDYAMTTAMNWHNNLASLQWLHKSSHIEWKQNAYVSNFGSSLSLEMLDFIFSTPSIVTRIGSSGYLTSGNRFKWSAGYEVGYTHTSPQNVDYSGYINHSLREKNNFNSVDYTISAQCEIKPTEKLSVTPWCKFSGITSHSYSKVFVCPGTSITLKTGKNVATAAIYKSLQTIHEAGFSDIGMASNFRITSTRQIKPQTAFTASIDYMRFLSVGHRHDFKLTAHAYYRKLDNAHEYSGNLLSVLKDDYNVTDNIISGNGYSAGGNVMLSKERGRISGHISYAYGITRLKFSSSSQGYRPSANDLGHAVTAYARYEINRRFDVSAAWSFTSGRRTTPIKSIYIISENVIMQHGERNSARLPDYHHLDIAANYHFTSQGRLKLRHTIAVSVFNAYGRDNVEMQSFVIDSDTGRYRMKQNKSIYKYMPSISYAVEF